MKAISHRELRNDSARILREVRAGETMQVTSHGEVVALPGSAQASVARSDDYKQRVLSASSHAICRLGWCRDGAGTA